MLHSINQKVGVHVIIQAESGLWYVAVRCMANQLVLKISEFKLHTCILYFLELPSLRDPTFSDQFSGRLKQKYFNITASITSNIHAYIATL
jgi:hypothetical protein